jgi:hypothetical protein
MLVGSSAVPGIVRDGDEVIAVTWDDWHPKEVISSVVDATASEEGLSKRREPPK